MKNLIKIIFAFMMSWMFFFPLTFTFLPAGVNSKMLMAAAGVILYILSKFKNNEQVNIQPDFVWMYVIACIYSLICYVSVTINNTNDYDYVTYFVSMSVWLCAAYASCKAIRYAHGHLEVDLISDYIILLCTIQCIIALSLDLFPLFKAYISQIFILGENTNIWESRLFGLGVSYDTAGVRFCIALMCLAYQMCRDSTSFMKLILYSLCFFIVFLIGNMLSRTTTVGAGIAACFIVYNTLYSANTSSIKTIQALAIVSIVCIPLSYILYEISPQIRDLARFGFEGFFSYQDSGEWHTHSNGNLQDMWNVWPDSLKTWLIGDGLFIDPNNPKMFYMHTDVGYARLIFYSGTIGLGTFCLFFIYLYTVLKSKFPTHSVLFLLLLAIGFVVWIKVATDIFFAFAFFLAIGEYTSEQTCIINKEVPNENTI